LFGSEADLSELPEGWIVVPLSEVVDKIVDGSHNPPPKQDSGRPMLSITVVDEVNCFLVYLGNSHV
jgi:hypothetical protein